MEPWEYMSGMGGFQQPQEPSFDYAALTRQLGDPNQALSAIMDARGENPNAVANPLFQGRSPSELALLDRYAGGQQAYQQYGPASLLGVIPHAGYEAMKGVTQAAPFLGNAFNSIGRYFGGGAGAGDFSQNQTSSPASFSNPMAYLRGAMGGFFGR